MLDADGGQFGCSFCNPEPIREDTHDLDAAIADAFPGARLMIDWPGREATIAMTYPDFVLDGGSRRRFEVNECRTGHCAFWGWQALCWPIIARRSLFSMSPKAACIRT